MQFDRHHRTLVLGALLAGATLAAAPAAAAQDRGHGREGRKGDTTGQESVTRQRMGSSGGAGALSVSERQFVHEMAHGNTAEIQLGKLAQRKGSSDQVKELGRRMAEDHRRAGEQLREAVGNVPGGRGLDPVHRRLVNQLSGLSGEEFDREFVNIAIIHHEKEAAALQAASQVSQHPGLQSWASQTLPAVQEHLRMAREIHGTAGGAGAAAGAPGQAGGQQDTSAFQETGRDTADAAKNPPGYRGMERDTTIFPPSQQDTSQTGVNRTEQQQWQDTSGAQGRGQNQDQGGVQNPPGYRGMERDTTTFPPRDQQGGGGADTSAAGGAGNRQSGSGVSGQDTSATGGADATGRNSRTGSTGRDSASTRER